MYASSCQWLCSIDVTPVGNKLAQLETQTQKNKDFHEPKADTQDVK
jgi:hypothetical protein